MALLYILDSLFTTTGNGEAIRADIQNYDTTFSHDVPQIHCIYNSGRNCILYLLDSFVKLRSLGCEHNSSFLAAIFMLDVAPHGCKMSSFRSLYPHLFPISESNNAENHSESHDFDILWAVCIH
jgi:hypothetical protein